MPSAANETEAFRRFLRRVWQEDVGPLLRDQRAVQRKKSARVAGTAAAGAGFDPDTAVLAWKTLFLCGARGMEFWHKQPHNIVFYEPSALGQLGFFFPAFKKAASWREAAQRRLGRSPGGDAAETGRQTRAGRIPPGPRPHGGPQPSGLLGR